MRGKISFNSIIEFFMAVIYTGCAIYLFIADEVFNFTSLQQYGLAAILLIYGIFRIYRSIKKYKRYMKDEE